MARLRRKFNNDSGMGGFMNRLSVLIAGVLLVVGGAGATEVTSVATTITRVVGTGTGTFYLSVNDDHPSCTNTATPKRYVAAVGQAGMTVDGLKIAYAAALLAAAADKQVQLYFDDATTSCYITRVLVLL